jgi:hypothetical protein
VNKNELASLPKFYLVLAPLEEWTSENEADQSNPPNVKQIPEKAQRVPLLLKMRKKNQRKRIRFGNNSPHPLLLF